MTPGQACKSNGKGARERKKKTTEKSGKSGKNPKKKKGGEKKTSNQYMLTYLDAQVHVLSFKGTSLLGSSETWKNDFFWGAVIFT
jgi:hypothetical protein